MQHSSVHAITTKLTMKFLQGTLGEQLLRQSCVWNSQTISFYRRIVSNYVGGPKDYSENRHHLMFQCEHGDGPTLSHSTRSTITEEYVKINMIHRHLFA